MWRIETGQTALRSLDVQAMCTVYGASDELTDELMSLAKETKANGWWHAYGDVFPGNFNLYLGLEQAASQILWNSPHLIPGIVQTEGYARDIFQTHLSEERSDEVERRIDARIARQAILTRATAAPTVKIALSEGVLRRPVGSRAVMAHQLERLMEVTDYPNVSIRVLAFETGLHLGTLSGPFVMMRFPTSADGRELEPPTVYVEGFIGGLYFDRPHETDRYSTTFDAIWGAALNEARSLGFLHEAAREFKR